MEKILVEISARHVHLCEDTLHILFGDDVTLTPIKELSQPGQYAAEEKVKIVGPKGELSARILGPLRKADQIEVSLTEARSLGVSAPIRESGDTKGSSAIRLVGPKGEVELPEGLIAAKRHVHMEEKDAQAYGVSNGDVVSIKVESPERSLTFSDVVVRVRDDYRLAVHIDTDEANAAGLSGSCEGELIK